MLVRSPRRFMLFSFAAFLFIFVVIQRSPWAHDNVYVQMPLLQSGGRPNLSAIIGGLNHDRIQAHLEDAWHHVLPKPIHSPSAAVETKLNASKASAALVESHPPWVTAPSRTEMPSAPFARPTNMKEYMKSMLKWNRPSWDGHWPPFADYVDKEYDPNRWEQFDM
jgi:hypothetical protein